MFREAGGTVGRFHSAGDAVHDFDTGDRVGPGAGFPAQHDGVGFFGDRVGDVGDFGAGGHWVGDHAFEHVGGDDHWLAAFDAAAHDAALDDGEFLDVDFDAEVAAGHHDGVGCIDDGVEVGDGLLVLDFGHDFRWQAGFLEFAAQKLEMGTVAHEAHGDPVDADFRGEADIAAVAVGERGQLHADTRQIDVASRSQFSFREHAADDPFGGAADNLHVKHAIIDEDSVPLLEVGVEAGVVDRCRNRQRGRSARQGEFHRIAALEHDWRGQVARADGGPLEVHEDRGILAGDGRCFTDARRHFAAPIRRCMTHVEAEDRRPRPQQGSDGFERLGGGTERGDDFRFADHESMGGKRM